MKPLLKMFKLFKAYEYMKKILWHEPFPWIRMDQNLNCSKTLVETSSSMLSERYNSVPLMHKDGECVCMWSYDHLQS
jgi:hypothetical protein